MLENFVEEKKLIKEIIKLWTYLYCYIEISHCKSLVVSEVINNSVGFLGMMPRKCTSS